MEKERVGQLLIKPSRKKMLNSDGPSFEKKYFRRGTVAPSFAKSLKDFENGAKGFRAREGSLLMKRNCRLLNKVTYIELLRAIRQ